MVDDLIDPSRRQWNLEMIDGLFNTEEADLIKTIPLSCEATEVTSYNYTQVWKAVWSMRAPPKVKMLPWRACREAIPTRRHCSDTPYQQIHTVSGATFPLKVPCTPCGLALNWIQCG
nr:hypothetical protein CFP56_64963 [Quercus suber]